MGGLGEEEREVGVVLYIGGREVGWFGWWTLFLWVRRRRRRDVFWVDPLSPTLQEYNRHFINLVLILFAVCVWRGEDRRLAWVAT